MHVPSQSHLGVHPAPLVPPDCNLATLPYWPVEIDRLRHSRSWARARRNKELLWYMMCLWMAAWQATPAGSLEDDDDLLCYIAECDPDVWPSVRDIVLDGWVRCSDGRLYHRFLSRRASEVWDSRLEYRATLAKARAAKAAKREQRQAEAAAPRFDRRRPPTTDEEGPAPTPAPTPPPAAPAETPVPICEAEPVDAIQVAEGQIIPPPPASSPSGNDGGCPPISLSQRFKSLSEKREGKKGSLRSPRTRERARGVCVPDPLFDQFWEDYPVKEGPRTARLAWDAAIARGAVASEILDGLAQHRFADHPRFIKHAANWLDADCWRSPGVRPYSKNGWTQILLDDLERRRGEGGTAVDPSQNNPFLAATSQFAA